MHVQAMRQHLSKQYRTNEDKLLTVKAPIEKPPVIVVRLLFQVPF